MESWFSSLRDYFPVKEMKSENHMKQLFKEKPDGYKLDEGPQYTLVYFEKPDFLFIDYILVNSSSRGSGLGSKIIDRVKKKNKMIILEVDPISQEDPETAKRVRFYQKQNFKKVPSIQYVRKHPITGERSEMDIFYWSPNTESEDWVMEKMKEAYEEVHAFKGEELYGAPPQTADEVLQLRKAKPQSKAE
ncbi:GNAT family N-acetyltransferase [Planomicrobium sp. CPCC 101110]|uniref:GNAT family N-acetyltransferase n=1 Tax=Planomicrobium sp. CPCC 101110 TaxID=2599619 RepID=UPI0011B59984|nr:GNAT family N-acetyltransferase [Planomicrobium sp. CPCC 101110]TWT28372.1 GNAT family N-acetyltransferase [Planomicrobium sp. CPCC 101110]